MKMTLEKSLMLKYNFLTAALIETEKHLVLKVGRDQQYEGEHGDAADSSASVWKRFQELKAELNSLKAKTLATDEWRQHTVFTNPAGLVVKSVRHQLNPDMCTQVRQFLDLQAWCKFAEILTCFPDLVPKSDCTFRSLHLCEAPGGFISALNQRLQNLGFNVSWDWFANSLNPLVVSAMKVEDWSLTLIEETRDRWLFGPDQTGDILKWQVFCDLRDRFASERFDLVTADGSFDCRQAPADQELATFPLQFCEVVCAFHLLRPSGVFVLKKFTTFEAFGVRMLYLLSCAFEQVDLFKPLTSKAGNSEVYVVCRRYLGLDDSVLAKLTVGYGHQDALELSSVLEGVVGAVLPEKFVSLVYESSARFAKCQSDMIQFNVDSFHLLRYTDEFAVDDSSRLKSFIDESKVAVLDHYWAKLDRMLAPIRDSERLVQHSSSS